MTRSAITPPATPRWPTPDFLRIEDPNTARIYDWAAGGSFNTTVDRYFGKQIDLVLPIEVMARRNHAFVAETLHHAFDNGVRQILDLGCGMPTGPAWHHRAAGIPGVSAVFVDYDPVVTNACILTLEQHPDPNSAVLNADLRDPGTVLASPQMRTTIDLTRPVILLATAVLHHIPDEHDLGEALAHYRDVLAPGSYLALSHLTDPEEPGDHLRLSAAMNLYRSIDQPLASRPGFVLDGWLTGLDPVPVSQHDPFLHFTAARIPTLQGPR
ncbi:SAM-dependent methyltransferase [Umezawaea sp. Da 62-37]|uniref:SAM-dependent methyltransferase n=1 Tax=Umezawaea sp. Da 62-37 TaxID=3075927 RepID=UPI0028F7241E|nr:SAM-dependent methyltransferase [Umezawaea sp. Da 62-37]WNV90252.1 SAM-dependent methyltransferase [Umezawaea sp. Da 62-37]